MAKRKTPEAIEGEVLPADPECGQYVPAISTKGEMNGNETTLGLNRPGRLNVRAQQAIMAAANRAAVILTDNPDATEVDYLCHMALAQPKAFIALFGKLVRQSTKPSHNGSDVTLTTTIVIGGKTLQ